MELLNEKREIRFNTFVHPSYDKQIWNNNNAHCTNLNMATFAIQFLI